LPSFIIERLECLSVRVSHLEYELDVEHRKRQQLEGIVIVYKSEFQKLAKANQELELKLSKVKEWSSVLNKMM
jgi:hypothetical protein